MIPITAIRRRAILALAISMASATGALAQGWQGGISVGRFTYDAGGDQGYDMLRVEVARRWPGWLSAAVAFGTSEVGPRNLGFIQPGLYSGNETVRRFQLIGRWHLGGLLAISEPGQPARVEPWLGASASVVWSQGRLIISEQVTDFTPPEDDSTIGPGLGLSAGLDVRVAGPLVISGGLSIWQDFLLGTSLTDYETWIGLGAHW